MAASTIRRVDRPDLPAPEPEHEVVLDRGRVAVAHDERDAAQGRQHGEGHDERWKAELDEVSVDEAGDEAEHQHGGNDDPGRQAEPEERDDENRYEGHERPDGKVDPGRRHDEGHAHRDDDDRGRLPGHVQEVEPSQEMLGGERHGDHPRPEREEQSVTNGQQAEPATVEPGHPFAHGSRGACHDQAGARSRRGRCRRRIGARTLAARSDPRLRRCRQIT